MCLAIAASNVSHRIVVYGHTGCLVGEPLAAVILNMSVCTVNLHWSIQDLGARLTPPFAPSRAPTQQIDFNALIALREQFLLHIVYSPSAATQVLSLETSGHFHDLTVHDNHTILARNLSLVVMSNLSKACALRWLCCRVGNTRWLLLVSGSWLPWLLVVML